MHANETLVRRAYAAQAERDRKHKPLRSSIAGLRFRSLSTCVTRERSSRWAPLGIRAIRAIRGLK